MEAMTDQRQAVMLCSNHWTSPFQVGSHYLARGLVEAGYRVAFLSDPISPLHLGKRNDPAIRERLAIHRDGGREDLDGRLWHYVPLTLLPPRRLPLLSHPLVLKNWPRLTMPSLGRLLRKHGFNAIELLYVDSLVMSPLATQIPSKRSVYRMADRNAAFDAATSAMIGAEKKLAAHVDLVVYTAKALRPDAEKLGARRVMHLPNGVDLARFEKEVPRPEEYASLPRPIVVYVGAIQEWFDVELTVKAARAMPEASFVLIGPVAKTADRFERLPNLHLFGARPHDSLPKYLKHADVGIIPFDTRRYRALVDAINPLKLYEYLAAGLPVVSVEWEELRDLDSPALLSRSPEEFVHLLRQACTSPTDRTAGLQFVSAHSWSGRARLLLDALR